MLCWILAVIAIPLVPFLLYIIGAPLYKKDRGDWPWNDGIIGLCSIFWGILTTLGITLATLVIVITHDALCHALGVR